MSIATALVGNMVTGLLGRFISSLAPILLAPLMINTWGLEVYGEWLLLMTIPTAIMLAPDFGLAGAVVNRMAYLTADGEENEAVKLYRSAYIVLLIASGFSAMLGYLVACISTLAWMGISKIQNPAAEIIGLSCLQIFLAQQGQLVAGIYRCARKNPQIGLINSVGQLIILLVSMAALLLRATPLTYMSTLVLASALFHAWVYNDAGTKMPRFALSLEGVSIKILKPMIVPGLGHAGMPIIHAFQNQGVLVLLGAFAGPANAALFQTVRVLSSGVKSILGLFAGAVMLELPFLHGRGRKQLVKKLLVRNSQAGFLVAAGAFVAMSIVGGEVYRSWLGGAIIYDQRAALLLMGSLVPFAIGNSFSIYLLATNEIHRAIPALFMAAIISLSMIYVGIEHAGVVAAALGVLFFEILAASVNIWTARPKLGGTMSYFIDFVNYRKLFADGREILRRVGPKS